MTLADQMRAWREQGDALKEQARARRVALLAELAEIDATLGGDVGASEPTRAPRPERHPGVVADRPSVALPAAEPLGGNGRPVRGCVGANGPGFRYTFSFQGKRYVGRTVPTRALAEAGLTSALAEHGISRQTGGTATAKPPANDAEDPEPAAALRRLTVELQRRRGLVPPRAENIPTLATDGERAKEQNNIPIVIPVDEAPDEADDSAFADLAPVPLDEIPALVAGPARTAPGVPTWILDRLLPAWWTAYQGIVVEGVHPDVVAYLNDTTAQEVSRKAKAAETQIERLRAWEAGRKEDGVPLTDEDKLGAAPAAPDPLLAALGIKQEPKTQGDAKRAALAAMSPHFHRLAPRRLQLAELYVAGKTNAEIAAEMGIKLASVDSQLYEIRNRLSGAGAWTAADDRARIAVVPPPDAQDAVIDSFKVTGVERARAKLHVINGRQRSATIAPRALTRDERRLSEILTTPTHIERPITRGDCEADPGRPCPWVGCSHHLYLDVNEDTGAIKLNFPHLEVWEMGESCSLDVADRGGVTLEEVGAIVNLTRERIRQIEVRGLDRMKDEGADDLLDGESPERFASPLGSVIG